VDTSGNVLVVDTFNDRVQVLKIQEKSSIEKVKEPEPKVTIAKKVPEPEPSQYYILTSNMNLREESNTDSNIIKLLRKGEEFQILDEYKQDDLNTWLFIKSKADLKGWICGIYRGKSMFKEKPEEEVKPTEPEPSQYYILTSNMNLREESNTDSNIIKLLRKGEEFQVLDEHEQDELNRWYFIETRTGLKGWFCGVYNGEVRFEKAVNREPDNPSS